MGRYTPKSNRVMFGWEQAFKELKGNGVENASSNYVKWVLNMESLELSDIKPKTERAPNWYINNPTRITSMTYDSEFKYGSGSFSGQLKHAHMIDAVMGGTTVTDGSTYDKINIVLGDRTTFFSYFEHSDSRIKDLIGCVATEVSIEGKEGEFITYSATALVAEMNDNDGASDINYAESNQDSDEIFGTAVITAAGQSFTGDGNILTKATIYLQKFAAPTGNATCKIYASTGSDPNKVPTGSALATSNTLDVTTLTTSYVLTDFTFSTAFTLVNGTEYFVVIEFTGDVSNYLKWGSDQSTPPAGSNFASYNVSWAAVTGSDGCFYIYTIGIVVSSALEDLDTEPYHWKHAKISLSVDGGMTAYTIKGVNVLDSFKIDLKNETEFKYGAPADGGQLTASWFYTKKFEGDSELVLYPEDDMLWLFAPSESDYVNHIDGTRATILYDTFVTSFSKGDVVEGVSSEYTATVVYNRYYGIAHYTTDDDLSLGYDWNASNQDFIITVNGRGPTSVYLTTDCDNIAEVVTAVNVAFATAQVYNIEAFISDSLSKYVGIRTKGMIRNSSFTLAAGGTDALATLGWDTGTYSTVNFGALFVKDISNVIGFTDNEELKISGGSTYCSAIVKNATILPLLQLDVMMDRSLDTHDFIKVTLDRLVIASITEKQENIEAGVDPCTVNFKLADLDSAVNVDSQDLLHDNSWSDIYP